MRTGYSGRVGIFEILELTPPLRALIEQPASNLLAEAVRSGMSTLHDDALRLCAAGTTSSDEVRRTLGQGLGSVTPDALRNRPPRDQDQC